MATIATSQLLTADEFAALPDTGCLLELVRGRIVEMNRPYPRHGQVCAAVSYVLQRYLEDHDVGHVIINDAGVLVERDPDTVRGPDIAFVPYEQIAKGPLPSGYLKVAPSIVFEIRSPTDRWGSLLAKVGEYLTAGSQVVCIVDPESEEVHVHSTNKGPQTLTGDQALSFPALLPGFTTSIRRFFE
jgi:Uma2 family endonuclease